MPKMLQCTPARTHLLIHLGNCSGLTDQLCRKYVWDLPRENLCRVQSWLVTRKTPKFFSPKLSSLIQCSWKPVCWKWGESELGGERGSSVSVSSCPHAFYRTTKERDTFSPTRYSWDEARSLLFLNLACRAGFTSPGTLSWAAEHQRAQAPSAWKRWCCWQGLWGLASGTKVTPSKSVDITLWWQVTETSELTG